MVFRAAAWVCVGLIALFSLMPHDMEVRTGLPGLGEHVLAYAGTAGLFGLGYPGPLWWRIALPLIVYSGCLEVLQGFVPGRTPELSGALSSGLGAVLGVLGAILIRSQTGLGRSKSEGR